MYPTVKHSKLLFSLFIAFSLLTVITLISVILIPSEVSSLLDRIDVKYFLFLASEVVILLVLMGAYVRCYPFNLIEASRFFLRSSWGFLVFGMTAPFAISGLQNLSLDDNHIEVTFDQANDLAVQVLYISVPTVIFFFISFWVINIYGEDWATRRL